MSVIDLLFILAGAFIYRMRGGMPPKLPWKADQIIFCLPYLALALAQAHAILALAASAATFAAVCTGHGNTMDLGEYDRKPEKYEILTRWTLPLWPSLYWYDIFAHSIGGLLITLPVGIVTLDPALALSGLAKGPAYAIAKKGGAGTAGGELLTGAILWGAI